MDPGPDRAARLGATIAAAVGALGTAPRPAHAQGTDDLIWRVFTGDVRPVLDVAFAADPPLVGSLTFTDSPDGVEVARLWNAADGSPAGEINPGPSWGLVEIEFAPTQHRAVLMPFADWAMRAPVYEIPSLEFIREIGFGAYGNDIQFSPSGDRFAVGGSGIHMYPGVAGVYPTIGTEGWWLAGVDTWPARVAWSADERLLAVVSGGVRLLDSRDGSDVSVRYDISEHFVCWGPGDAYVATASEWAAGDIRFRDPFTLEITRTIDTGGVSPELLLASPDRSILVAVFAGGLLFWRASDLEPLESPSERYVTSLAFAPDSKRYVAGFDNGDIAILHSPRLCPSDCDRSGTVDAVDFVCFQAAWRAREAYADFDASGRWDVNDFIAFYSESLVPCQ